MEVFTIKINVLSMSGHTGSIEICQSLDYIVTQLFDVEK